MIEDLTMDKNGNFSSRPRINSGPNRGRSKPEIAGITWCYLSGYSEHVLGDVRSAHWAWAQKLDNMGCRVGVTCDRDFYICMKNGKIVMRVEKLTTKN